ncbi:uncharacterized protein [Salminus brasiliensis]|uniref:uncharacterized protein isoform X2 n=1 Tax=Salminus brasiliensis TaxID=930266 RepID=UPI003B839553
MEAPDDGAELFLHCLVSPARLLCAAIWQLIQQEDVSNYGLLEEFVSLVTDTIPDLLSCRQKTELTIGLRARLVLELCDMEGPAYPDLVQTHLQRIQTLLALHKELEADDGLVEESGTNFVSLVQILMKDPVERSIFFKDVFPLQYGVKFSAALKKLMWMFLCRLEKALPQPTMEETAQLLSAVPAVMEQCVQSISQPQQLISVFKYQRAAGVENKEKPQLWSTTPDDCILSCLGSPQLVQLVIEEPTPVDNQSESVLDYPPSYCQEVQIESVVIAQYIDSDLESRQHICEVSIDGIECFDAGETKEYELRSLDQDSAENSTELVYAEVESIRLGAVDYVLDERSEKQDPLKSEVTVEELVAVNSREAVCQEENRMAKDSAVEDEADCPKLELTQESAGERSDHISASAEAHSEESEEPSGLVTSCLVKQACVKLDRLDITGKPVPQPFNPEPLKRGRGRPRKRPRKIEVWKEKDPCASIDKPLEVQNVVSRAIQKLKKTYIEVKGSSVVYACSLCTFQGSEEAQLNHHLIATHREEYQRLCEDEEDKAAQISAPSHSESKKNQPLTKIRLYRGVPVCKTCPVCGKTFTRSSDMRRHQTLHTVARPFTCLYCGKTFRYTFDLKRHQQHACPNQSFVAVEQEKTAEVADAGSEASAASNNENLLPTSLAHDTVFCRVCRITLPNSSSLEKHMETHSKGILHTCPCGKTYKYVENMRIHQLVCPESDLHKHEQKQCDERDDIEGDEEVRPDDSAKSHPQDSGQSSEEAASHSSPVPGAAFNSGERILQVPQTVVEFSENPDIGTPGPNYRSSSSTSVGLETRRHLRSSTSANAHKCAQCGDGFKYSYNLKKHEDVCEGKKQPKGHSRSSTVASGCKNIEVGSSVLLDDQLADTTSIENVDRGDQDQEWQENEAPSMKTVLSGSVFSCDKCGKKCKDLHSLRKHKKPCDLKEQRYKCVKCGSSFRTLLEVRKHVRTHWGEDPLQCSQCGRYFQSPSELSKHKVVHEKERSYPCTLCLETLERLDSLRQHYQEVHEFTGPYQCPHCDKSHMDLGSMVVHIRTHNDERPYQCPHCSKSFKYRSGLNVHEKLHSGDRPFLCEACGKSFSSNIQLQRHSVSHSSERPYACSECKKSFKSQHALRGHSLKHSKPANIPCEVCGKMFSQPSALDRHHRTHTGERPYSCPKCSKTFLTSGEVAKHLRYHTGERPFQCPRCSKSFTQTCYLTAHMRIHTGERPYVCSVCDKSFVCSTHLKRHMFVHTQEKPFQCVCGKAFNRRNLLRVHQKSQCFLQQTSTS